MYITFLSPLTASQVQILTSNTMNLYMYRKKVKKPEPQFNYILLSVFGLLKEDRGKSKGISNMLIKRRSNLMAI